MFGLFRRPSPEERRQAEAVKAIVREHLGIGEAGTVSVSEIKCGDAACPGIETVILIMLPGRRTRACKVPAPLADITADRVVQALALPEM